MGIEIQKQVFIVDDNDANLTMEASVLEEFFKVFTIPSAEKMFFLLGKKRADLILLDVEMPEMSGFEAMAKLKENPDWKEIPVIFVTGWSDEKLIANAKKAGVLDIIKKPIVPSVLLECVKKNIGK